CYDAPFHINAAKELAEIKSIKGINAYYPPLYHILLVFLNIFTGIEIFNLARIILPLASVVLALGAFAYFDDIRKKIAGSVAISIMPPLLWSSFDSPENIALLLLLGSMLLIKKRKQLLGEVMLMLTMVTNYFVFIIGLACYLALQRLKAIRFVAITAAMLLFMNLFGLKLFVGLSIFSGMKLIQYNIKKYFWSVVLGATILVMPFLVAHIKERRFNFWSYCCFLSLLGLYSFFITPVLRAWEFTKFLGLSSTFVSVNYLHEKILQKWFILAMLVCFLISVLISANFLFPRLHLFEVKGIEKLGKLQGKILAEPSLGEYILLFTNKDEKEVSNKLFYEKRERIDENAINCMLELKNCEAYSYWPRNFEDDTLRPVKKQKLMERFSKIYAAKSNANCIIKGPNCGELEFYILKFRD
ncbi:MAG: hypothetical protein DRO04_01290, partial [Candidatus Iainarchaeum archaeon]